MKTNKSIYRLSYSYQIKSFNKSILLKLCKKVPTFSRSFLAVVLVDISHDTGISRNLIIRLLEGKNDHQHVIELDNAARKMGINSAPTFILNGKHVITGAQNVEFWSNLIIEVKDNIDVWLRYFERKGG